VWAGNDGNLFAFVWPFYDLILGLIAIFCIYFIYVFLLKNDVGVRLKIIFLTLLAPILILAPTNFNLGGFNITNCDAFDFESLPLKTYTSSLGFLAMVWILILFIHKYRTSDSSFRKQIILMGTGIELFLFSFFGMEFLATYLTRIGFLPNSGLELYGLFGMVIFMIYISILIVRFKTFNGKLFATQVLVWALVILVGSEFFFAQTSTVEILIAITLVISAWLGLTIIRSVKKEIEAKENERLQHLKYEELANRFENINHILAHDVKNTLGKNKDIFVELNAGTFGEITDQGKNFLTRLTTDTRELITSVTNILKAGDKMKPDPKSFDFKQALLEVIESVKDEAEKKGLKIETQIDEKENYMVNADRSLIVPHVLKNLIENAVNYNIQNGSIWINLSKKDPKTVLLVVKDNGHGMSEETKKKLFTAGGHGEDSLKFNVHTSGYGLLIARQTMDAHSGKVDGSSEGKEKGSTFFIELPVDFTPVVDVSKI
jgi:signal transduction histidine kinase